MGLKLGHHFTAAQKSDRHWFLVHTFTISVKKPSLIHIEYTVNIFSTGNYILFSFYAHTMKTY